LSDAFAVSNLAKQFAKINADERKRQIISRFSRDKIFVMKIICIGRNYVDHAKELNNAVPTEPLYFMKADSCILPHRHPLYIPEFTKDLHFEVEVVVKINRLGKAISPKHAHRYYDEISLGIDFTARDLQQKLKSKGHPWEKAKSFDGSAALSRQWIPVEELGGDIQNIDFSLTQNGEKKQIGNTKNMIFSVNEIICYVSQFMTLKMGDLIYTGTPAGVGKVEIEDELKCFIGDREMLKVRIK